jgi:serine/threonine protein kinase
MSHQPGEILQGRYHIDGPIGQGGMGAVYRATDQQSGKVVAVKQLRTDTAAGFESGEMLQRFEGEWHLLRTLNHPRIPRMLDSFRCDECGYYVMEFIDGQSLDEVMREYKRVGKRFPEEQLIQYCLQILDVLDYLHSLPKPLLHRDVKPANVIVRDGDEELFLVDFGLAREGGSATTKTLVGTLGYAHLEQVKGHPEERSDLYALGASMWHMLVGEQPAPFDIPPLASVRNDVHPALAEVVDRACQDHANRRYASARKMEIALRQALAVMTGQVESGPTPESFLAERPDGSQERPLDAKEFLLRAGLATASLLLLMVVGFRVKSLLHRPNPKPVASASVSPESGTATPKPLPDQPRLPAPPPYELISASSRLNLQPLPPALQSSIPCPPGWQNLGFLGQVGAQELVAPAGESAALLQRREGAREVSRIRMTVSRHNPATVQFGLMAGDNLVVGAVSLLENGMYHTTIQAGGRASRAITRPWNRAIGQTLELERRGQQWLLRDLQENLQVELEVPSAPIDSVQIILPAARQRQVLGILDLSVTDL